MRKKTTILFYLIWFILHGTILLRSNHQTIITGTVEMDDGTAIAGVKVSIKDTRTESITDENGIYTLKTQRTGTIIITAYLKGLKKEIKSIYVKKGKVNRLPFILKTQKINYNISVKNEPPKLMSASENIGVISVKPDQISNLPTLGEQDIFRSFQLMPGISASSESSSGLYVRGGKPDENLILYDGFTVYHVDHFFGIFSAFNANAIEEVKLFKGGFESKYGGRISSVMEITGKSGLKDSIKFGGGINFLSFNGYAEIPISDKGAIFLSGRKSFQSPLYNTILGNYQTNQMTERAQQDPPGGGKRFAGLFDTEPKSFFYDLNGKAIFKPSKKDIIYLSFYKGMDDLDNSKEFELPSFMAERAAERGFDIDLQGNSTDYTRWGNTGLSSNWLKHWNDSFSSEFTIGYSKYFYDNQRNMSMQIRRSNDNGVENPVEGNNGNNNENVNSENNLLQDYTMKIKNKLTSGDHLFEFGAQITKNIIDYNYSESNFRKGSIEQDEIIEPENILNLKGNGIQASGFIQSRLSFANKIIITPGIRLTYFDQTRKTYFEPRFSLIANLNEKIKLKTAWGKYFQYVNRLTREDILQGDKDFWVISDGKNVPVSYASHYIAGISYETETFLLNIETYYKDLENISLYAFRYTPGMKPDPSGINYSDYFFSGSGYAKGIEFLLQKKYGDFSGWISYTLGKVQYQFPEISDSSFAASHDATHEFKFVGSYKLKKWTLASTFIYASGKPYTEPLGAYQEIVYNENRDRDMIFNIIEYGEKNGSRLPDYHRLDLSITYDFKIGSSDISAGISVFNLYNHKNVWKKTYDIAENELIETDINYLGITPSLFLKIRF